RDRSSGGAQGAVRLFHGSPAERVPVALDPAPHRDPAPAQRLWLRREALPARAHAVRPQEELASVDAVSRLIALAAAAMLAACSRGDESPYFGATARIGKAVDTIYINSGGEPEFIDPGKCTDTLGEALIVQLFEGLTGIDPRDGHPV